jgi:hypothetical protein
MKINYYVIEKVAAEVFWQYVHENGMDKIEDKIPSMWSHKIAKIKLQEIGYEDSDLTTLLYKEVLDTILTHIKEEKNIMGPIYIEDFEHCREEKFLYMSFLDKLNDDSDYKANYKITKEGKFSHTGDLLLRTPFPSGILLREHPSKYNIIIPDTNKALGFQKTLVLYPTDFRDMPSNPYGYNFFITGIFHIPTVSTMDQIWYKIIPNASCALGAANFYSTDGQKSSLIIKSKNKNSIMKYLKML